MRVLVISDIHANLTAFEAVMADAAEQWDKIWCLGDLIGYGPDPNECVALLRQFDHLSLSGNHDWAVLGKIDIKTFNPDAQRAIQWTRDALSSEARTYLESLPTTFKVAPFTLAHASPRQPVWEYIVDQHTASINFNYFDTTYCLVGHTHVPVTFAALDADYIISRVPTYKEPMQLHETRLIINPGSVGQPRDANPQAAYAVLDTDNLIWEFRRVPYDVHATQERMRQHSLPARLIKRLEHGW